MPDSPQWKIYDAYIEEVQKQEKNKEKQKVSQSNKERDKSVKKVLLMESQVRQELSTLFLKLIQPCNDTCSYATVVVLCIYNFFLFLLFFIQTNDINKVNSGAKILERMVNQNLSNDIAHGVFK